MSTVKKTLATTCLALFALCGAKADTVLLPAQYRQVEYIESTGKECINSGYNRSSKTSKIYVKYYTTNNGVGTGTGTYRAIFGEEYSSGNRFFVRYNNGSNSKQLCFYDNNSGAKNLSGAVSGTNEVTAIFSGTTGSVQVNEATSKAISNNSSFSNKPIFIFSAHNGSSKSAVRIITFKIWETVNGIETLVRNYVPCYRVSDGEVGLYEAVTGSFLTNYSTTDPGAFLKGPDCGQQPLEIVHNLGDMPAVELSPALGLSPISSGVEINAQALQTCVTNAFKMVECKLYGWELAVFHNDGTVTCTTNDIDHVTSCVFTPAAGDAARVTWLWHERDIRPPLPAEYRRVEYIETTGDQSINSGYIRSAKTSKIYVKYYTDNYGVGNETTYFRYVFGEEYTSANRFFVRYGSAETAPNDFIFYDNAGKKILSGSISGTNEITAVFSGTTGSVKVNDGSPVNITKNSSFSGQPIFICSDNNGYERSALRLYEFKIFETDGGDETLVRDYVPCYRVTDGAIGLYETVTGSFIGDNRSSGVSFLKGSNCGQLPLEIAHNLNRIPEVELSPVLGVSPIAAGVEVNAQALQTCVTNANETFEYTLDGWELAIYHNDSTITYTTNDVDHVTSCVFTPAVGDAAKVTWLWSEHEIGISQFAVLNAAGEQVGGLYTSLDAAFAAVENNGTIELRDNSKWDSAITVTDKRVTLRSEPGHRYKLTRISNEAVFNLVTSSTTVQTPSSLYTTYSNESDSGFRGDNSVYSYETARIAVTNLVLDGGAVWNDADDPKNSTLMVGSVTGGRLAVLNDSQYGAWNRYNISGIYLDDGAEIRNYSYENSLIDANHVGSAVRMLPGSKIRNCRGNAALIYGSANSRGYIRLAGAEITGCKNANSGNALIHIAKNGPYYFSHSLRDCVITNNIASSDTYGTVYSGAPENPNYEFAVYGRMIVRDNFLADGTTPANVRLSAASINPRDALDSEAYIGIKVKDQTVATNLKLGKATYFGDDANVAAIHYDGNPVAGVDYVARISGSALVWKDATVPDPTDGEAIFNLKNPGEEPVLYNNLAKAFADAENNAVIELTADGLLRNSIIVTNNVTLTSAEGYTYTLTRSEAASFQIKYIGSGKIAGGLTITNLTVDGGTVWTNPDTITDMASTGIDKVDFVILSSGNSTYRASFTLGAGATLRNFKESYALIMVNTDANYGVFTMEPGSLITDCRGNRIFQYENNYARAYFRGGVITRCSSSYGPSSGTGGGLLAFGGTMSTYEFGGFTMTNNYMTHNRACAVCYAGNNSGSSLNFTGGKTVIRDNYYVNGQTLTEKDFYVDLSLTGKKYLTGAMDAESDVGIKTSGTVEPGVAFMEVKCGTDPWINPFVFRSTDDAIGLLRGKMAVDGSTTNLVWAQTAIAGETVELPADTVLSGDLTIASRSGMPDTSASYTLLTGENISGSFANVALDPTMGKYWKVKYGNDIVRTSYVAPCTTLIIR